MILDGGLRCDEYLAFSFDLCHYHDSWPNGEVYTRCLDQNMELTRPVRSGRSAFDGSKLFVERRSS